MEKLPRVYASEIKEDLHNNKKLFDGRSFRTHNERNKDIFKEIDKIFSSKDFVYKKMVIITMKDNTQREESLVGRNNNSLFTLDGKKVLISDILDIKKRD